MKIDLNTIRADSENFMVHEHFVGGEPVYLVQPVHIGSTWTKDNLIYRSSVWSKDGEPVSLSWKKFANYGEKPEVFNVPSSLDGCQAMEKIDGSTLIVSMWNGNLVVRTRGTVDASMQDNGWEIQYLKDRYPLAFSNAVVQSGDASVIFEWTSPTNRIVINYGDEPLLYLTGIVSHDTYRYTSQETLDYLAGQWGVLRPRRYSFNSMSELQEAVKAFRGVEGVCLYFHDGQEITKLKGDEYLFLHRAKSDVASVEKVMDLYLDQMTVNGAALTYSEFFSFLENAFDYEIAVMARGHVSNICDGMKEAQKIVDSMESFVAPLRSLSRKDAALAIMQAYGNTNRSGYAFKRLDQKPLDADAWKKLLFQCLKG